MTQAKKILFITQELTPYVPESQMALIGRKLPQAIQDSGREIRTFMPKWGNINERRNQLHEVIRLSGLNIAIDDTDHPLIIKVASIQAARMQVYFIDNDDFFHKRTMLTDSEGKEYDDNGERAVFYARGVLETLKKLRWCPDVIHCHGWMSAFVPFYIKTAYRNEPSFVDSKVVFSAYDEMPLTPLGADFPNSLLFREANAATIEGTGIDFTAPDAYARMAIAFADGYIQGAENAHPEYLDIAREKGIPAFAFPGMDDMGQNFGACYDSLFAEGE